MNRLGSKQCIPAELGQIGDVVISYRRSHVASTFDETALDPIFPAAYSPAARRGNEAAGRIVVKKTGLHEFEKRFYPLRRP